jgi:hypothetical protein
MREPGTITIITPQMRLRHSSKRAPAFPPHELPVQGWRAGFPGGMGLSDAFGLDDRVLRLSEVDEAVLDVSAN